MAQFWPSVPQVRWPGSKPDASEVPETAEPSVTANVAGMGDSPGGTVEAGRVTLTESLSNSPPTRSSSSLTTTTVTELPLEGGANGSLVEAADQRLAAGPLPEGSTLSLSGDDRSEDQIERLKAALHDDARRADEPNRQSGGANDVRVRVESLLERARRSFAIGQLTEARRTAKLAQDLGETARLDYSPDEERPVDLVNRIDDQMQETADVSGEPAQEITQADTANSSRDGDSSAATARLSQRDEGPARSWLRGYGAGVFRREKKGTAAESAAPEIASSTPPSAPAIDFKPETALVDESTSAVVQANRSVALPRVASASPASAHLRETVNEDDSNDGADRAALAHVKTDETDWGPAVNDTISLVEPRRIASPNELDGAPQRIVDESTAAPPEFEEVRPVSPIRNVGRKTKSSRNSGSSIQELTGSTGGWLIGGGVFAVCSLLALACYRRGAT